MKTIISLLFFTITLLAPQVAKSNTVKITDISIEHTESSLVAEYTVDGSLLHLKSNREVLVRPFLYFANGDSLPLQPVLFGGRNRIIQAERHPCQLKSALLKRSGETVTLSQIFPYSDYMENGRIEAVITNRGCCNSESEERISFLNFALKGKEAFNFSPRYRFITPAAEGKKSRSLAGKAYIDFRVNRTEIDPQYRNNPHELGVIYATIDSVVADPDVSLKSLSFTGYASPEGSYANNTRLAKGRTEALSNFVKNLYNFPESIVKTFSEPEDWNGLYKTVAESNLPSKEAILSLISDLSLDPDTREKSLAKRFPEQYRYIYDTIYPALRHCDYEIQYDVASYDDPATILRLVETNPRKLSLREMFVAANTLEPGSDLYCRVFDTAARLYPESEIANLNAGISEMQRGSLAQAEYFLQRAGESPEAVYARGLLQAFTENYNEARITLAKALELGVEEAEEALGQLPAEK